MLATVCPRTRQTFPAISTLQALGFGLESVGTIGENFRLHGVSRGRCIRSLDSAVWRYSCLSIHGYLFMATNQIQSGGAASPVSTGPWMAGSSPAGEDSFAFTLSRALEDALAFAQHEVAAPPGILPAQNAPAATTSDSVTAARALVNSFATNLGQSCPRMTMNARTSQLQQGSQNSSAEPPLQSPANMVDGADVQIAPANVPGKSFLLGLGAVAPGDVTGLQVADQAAGGEKNETSGFTPLPKAQGVKFTPMTRTGPSRSDPRTHWPVRGQTTGVAITGSANPPAPLSPMQPSPASATPTVDRDVQIADQSNENASPLSATDPGSPFLTAQAANSGGDPASVRDAQNGSTPGQSLDATATLSSGARHPEVFGSSQSAPAGSMPMSSPSRPARPDLNPWAENASATMAASFPLGFNLEECKTVPGTLPLAGPEIPSKTQLPQMGEEFLTPHQAQPVNAIPIPEPDSAAASARSPNFSDGLRQTGNIDPAQVQTVVQGTSGQGLPIAIADSSPAGESPQSSGNSEPTNVRPPVRPPANGLSDLPALEALFGKLPFADLDVQVSGSSVAMPAIAPKSSAETNALPATLQSSNPERTSGATTQFSIAPKPDSLSATATKGPIHPAQASMAMMGESSWQSFTESGIATARILGSTPASPSASIAAEPNLSMAPPACSSQTQTPALPVHSSGAPAADSTASATSSDPGGSSSAEQGKAGQQSGSGAGDSPVAISGSASATIANLAAGSPTNPLVVVPPNVPAAHATVSAPPTMQTPIQPPSTLSAWQNYDGAPGKIVQSAMLSNSSVGAEMHVELRTSPLGPLEVHTVVHDGSVGAEIRVQGSEAHTLLTAGLPSLEHALGQQNLRVENLRVYQDMTGGGSNSGAGHDAQSGSNPSLQRQNMPGENLAQPGIPSTTPPEEEDLSIPVTGLSVRA